MPRKARIDAPGALHHIIIRGIERKLIFQDSQDYRNFIERLGEILNDTATVCYAWAQMKNHAHLTLSNLTVGIAAMGIYFRIVISRFCAKKILIYWNLCVTSISILSVPVWLQT
ncbi:MAG: transposase [Planctomycetota bacterium]|jgi:hypothetical protein